MKRYLDDIECASILLELDYVDHDYLDDFANYYVKCFTPYRRYCRRAHFWSINICDVDIEKAILENDVSLLTEIARSYLGFMVIKPLPDAVVGRTVLKPYESDDQHRYYTAIKEHTVNLFGFELSIEGLAFQEQDTVLAACATTALWSALQKTSSMFQTYLPTPSDITKKATKYIQTTRPVPSHGLNVEQICYAISEVGLTPEVQQINENTPINSLIYSYVIAGLPVILGYKFISCGTTLYHAVTICGYRLEDTQQLSTEVSDHNLHLRSIGQRISEFYVHDDTLGPYSRLKTTIYEAANDQPVVLLRETELESFKCQPIILVVPIYHKVRLSFTHVKGAIREFDNYLRALGIHQEGLADQSIFEWDIQLMDITNLRKKILDKHNMDRNCIRELLFQNLPRFSWISIARLNGEEVFCIICDATDMERAFSLGRLICFMPGIRENIKNIIIEGDPDLEMAAQSNLPSPFVYFLKREFLE